MPTGESDLWFTFLEMQKGIYEGLVQEFFLNSRRVVTALELPARMASVKVGPTPRERIWKRNKATLYRYHLPEGTGTLLEEGREKPRLPLLIIYALINKPYVLDLRANNSFIAYLLQRGFDVFLLDWGTPGDEDAKLGLENYIMDYMARTVHHMRKVTGEKQYSMLGYCMGGTMSTVYTATYPEDQPDNLVLLAAPIDFSQPNTFKLWLDPKYFNADVLVDTLGLVPAEIIDFGSKMLKPFQNYVQNYLDLHGKLWDDKFVESWLAMNKWVNDGVPMAGETYRQWVHDFYQQNKLVKGELVLRDRQVKLCNITSNILSVIAERDHIAPPAMTAPLMHLVSSKDKTQYLIPAGHVGMVAGRGAVKQLWPYIADWLEKRSE